MFNLHQITGIYVLTCTTTGRRYVGKCASRHGLRHRWQAHKTTLRSGNSGCIRLQVEWTKYGESSFVWEIVEPISTDRPDSYFVEREKHWIEQLNPELNMIAPGESPMLGRAHSPASKERMSASQKSLPEEVKRRRGRLRWEASKGMPGPNYGRRWSDDTKKAISQGIAELWADPTYAQHMSDAHKGKVSPRRRRVEATNLATGKITVYPSLAHTEADGFHRAGVRRVATGEARQHGGHTWRYLDS